jgi:hypothetical protein
LAVYWTRLRLPHTRLSDRLLYATRVDNEAGGRRRPSLISTFFSKEMLVFAVPILIGIGIGVSGKVDHLFASIAFAASALWAWIGIVRWDRNTTEPLLRRGVISVASFVVLGTALVFSIRWVYSPQPDLVDQLYDRLKPLVGGSGNVTNPSPKASVAVSGSPTSKPPSKDFSNALNLMATRWPDTFTTGSLVDGFQWRPYYSAIMLSVTNDKAVPIESIDLTMSTDQAIADVGIEHGNGVEIVTTPNLTHVVTLTGEDGKQVSRQVQGHGVYLYYQTTCRRLLPKNSFSLLLATAAMNASEYSGKTPATILNVTGSYVTEPADGGKRYTIKWKYTFP